MNVRKEQWKTGIDFGLSEEQKLYLQFAATLITYMMVAILDFNMAT